MDYRYLQEKPLGYEQLTNITTAQKINPPVGTVLIIGVAEGAPVRWRDDGIAPTAKIGMPVGDFEYTGALKNSNIQFIGTDATSVMNLSYYGHV